MISRVMSLGSELADTLLTAGSASHLACVERAAKGDCRAFEHIYRTHVGRVHGLCLRMCRDRFEAEECTQEAFVQAWRKLRLFRGESELGTWLHRIAANTVIGRMRKSKRDKDRLTFVDETPEESSPAISMDHTGDLETALQRLPGGARSVVVLCGIYGYSHAEASAMLGIAVGTCKAQLHRARKLLTQHLAEAD